MYHSPYVTSTGSQPGESAMPPPTDPTLEFEHNLGINDSRKDAAESSSTGCPCPKYNSLSTAPVIHPEHRPEPLVELDSLPQPEPLQGPSHMSGDEDPKSNTYPYQPLQYGREIRLLFLRSHSPASSSAQHDPGVIPATLQNVELNLFVGDSSPKTYRALSYEWGPPPEKDTDLPTINLDGYKVRVRQNLYDALKAIIAGSLNKSGDVPVPLWVDALCINQSDDNEKGHQVELMRDIFAAAETVLVWLGSEGGENGTVTKVMDEYMDAADKCHYRSFIKSNWRNFLGKVVKGPTKMFEEKIIKEFEEEVDYPRRKLKFHQLVYGLWRARLCKIVWQLGEATYWRRVWIIQEFVMAENYILVFGKDYLTKKKFEEILERMKENDRDKSLAKDLGFSISGYLEVPYTEIPACRMIQLRKMKKKNYTTLEQWVDLCQQNRFRATDPRDYVYALLGISDDCIGKITPDYTRSVRDVYFSAIEVMSNNYHSWLNSRTICERFAKLLGLSEEDAIKAKALWKCPEFQQR